MPLTDFAILTGLTEEFIALKRVLPDLEEVSENSEVWYRARVRSDDGTRTYSVVAGYQTEMGPLGAQALTNAVIRRWDPAYILLVGIAGSFQKEVRLGDVIISQQVFYYDLAKATETGIRYRPQGYPCSLTLIRQAEALSVGEESLTAWQAAASASAAELAEKITGRTIDSSEDANRDLLEHKPNVHFGTVASGSLVIADTQKQQELLALHGKIVGTEMEGAGVLFATYSQEVPTPAVVMKGVSDAADSDKDSEDTKRYWRELAKQNSARVALALIRRGRIRPLGTDEFRLDPVLGPPGEARDRIRDASAPGVAYLAFPRLVVPAGPLTEFRLTVKARSNAGPLSVRVLLLEFLDRDGKRQQVEVRNDTPVELMRPIAAHPVGAYALIAEAASDVEFEASTPAGERRAYWRPKT